MLAISRKVLSGLKRRVVANNNRGEPLQHSVEEVEQGPDLKLVQGVRVLTDAFETTPFLDFGRYSETITRVIRGSEPNFSLGIYGEWGTGKTTLMRLIETKLNEEGDILTVWFNAWRYEREDQFAAVSLMKSIAYRMDEHPKYKKAKEVLLKSIMTVGKGLASKYLLTEKSGEEFQKNFISEMKVLAEADKDTIYFQGLKKIEDTIDDIIHDSPQSRVVVFIDDLDRCSPTKVIEVFESIKAFLDLKGFIYVVGLSYETISKLITAQYEKSGIKGEQYIKKIIQIPIRVPDWNTYDIGELIEKVLSTRLDSKYSKIVSENKTLISIAVEANPREVKSFINNFIVSYEIFSVNPEIRPKELLVIQALKVRWSNFYRGMTSDKEFRKEVERYSKMDYAERTKSLQDLREKQNERNNLNTELEKKFLDIDSELWKFLDKEKEAIFGIQDWEIYRRAVESVKDMWEYLQKGDYYNALEVSDKALQIDPNNAIAWYNKGIALDILARYQEAIACFDQSIRLEPTVYALLAKSRSLSLLGKHEEVIKACDEALKIDPQYGAAWYNKALSFEELQRFEEALKCYDKITDPDMHMLTRSEAMFTVTFDNVWIGKGKVLDNLGRYKEALKCYDESLKINPDNASAWYNKGNDLEKLGEGNKAKQHFDRARQLGYKG